MDWPSMKQIFSFKLLSTLNFFLKKKKKKKSTLNLVEHNLFTIV